MADPHGRYALTELADLAGVTPRTVRFYLSQGLLPSAGATGPGVKYGDEHLHRLRLIRRLQREHLPLAEIRQRLAGLDGPAIARLAETALADDDPMATGVDPTDTALDYVRRILAPEAVPRTLAKRTVMAAEAPAPLYSAPAPPSAPESPLIERSQWERITLAPDVELHVRRPLPRPLSKQVDRLVSIARELLEEDPS